VQCPWGKRRKTKRLNELQERIDRLPKGQVALYVDEVDIHLNAKIGYDWMQKTVLTPGMNKKHYLAGALNAHTGEVMFVESDCKDSQMFIAQLSTLVERDYPDAKHIHLILDNYCIHCSGVTQLAVSALADRMTLHFLPPYCPNHIRIERVWKDLHAEVTRNHACKTMDRLMAKHQETHHQQKPSSGTCQLIPTTITNVI
jgi:transposase